MQTYHNNIFNFTNTEPDTTASVYVYQAGTGALATIYDTDEITTFNNPFTISDSNYDANGNIRFKAANGEYDIKVVSGGSDYWKYRIYLFDEDDQIITINNDNWSGTDLSIANGGTGGSTAIAGFDNLSPLTTQADVLYHDGTNNVRLAKGTANQVLAMNSGATAPEWQTLASAGFDYIKLTDTQTAGTDGGTFTSGSWQTRTLNTEDNDTGGDCTLSSNQFTLAAGTYAIYASAPAFGVNRHKTRLQNITDATTTIIGTSERSGSADGTQTRSIVIGYFTIASAKAFELQHYAESTAGTTGLGYGSNFGVSEIYAQVELLKVA